MNQTAEPLFSPVQTNTGLYCQLHDAGHSTPDLLQVREVYRVCCRLFNGRYRKTERAFICHAVGAASATAWFDRRIDVICAAMLHAAYDSGAFPDGRTGPSSRHRRWLADWVGAEIEARVESYSRFSFAAGEPERLVQCGIPHDQRDNLRIALAHEIDDLADGGLAFAPKYGRSIESRAAACAQLARNLGIEDLARVIEHHAARYRDVAWLEQLESSSLEGFRIAPNLRTCFRLFRDAWRGRSVDVFSGPPRQP